MKRETVVVAALAALLPLLFFGFGPIAQIETYHDLADQRTLLGIPHFWNVVSNLPFLVIGLMGLRLLCTRREDAQAAWVTLFAGIALCAFGSVWYHIAPSDPTLVWDRVPIGIAFMGFFCALLAEHLDGAGKRAARLALFPLASFSVAAILWWRSSGDLSLWIWVQLAPMLAIVMVLALLRGRYSHRRYMAWALAWYVLAKALELGDTAVMGWTGGAMSGHALKHFAAAAGVWCLYLMLRDRTAEPR